MKVTSKANLALCILLLGLFPNLFVKAVPIFSEDWESGQIDSAKWNKVEYGDITLIQKIRKEGTNHVLAQEIGAEGRFGYVYVETKDTFTTDNGLKITYRQYRFNTGSPKDANFKIFEGSNVMLHLDWDANPGMLYGYRRVNGHEQSLPTADLGNFLNQWTDWTIVYTPGIQPNITIQAYAGLTKIYDVSVDIDSMNNVKLQFKTWNNDNDYNKTRWDDIAVYIPEPISLLVIAVFSFCFMQKRKC